MKKILLGLMILGLTIPLSAQVVKLSEVVVSAANYKYMQSVGYEAAVPVQLLEEKVATFDLKNSELYSDEYDTYTISFYIPEGKIVALYDNEGNVLRTIERFENIAIPTTVKNAIDQRFPGWEVKKDVYKVTYNDAKNRSTKFYKVKLENGDQLIRIKIDDEGNFL
ncbi:nicotinate-nucleotide adenylyltransferase [Robertkochia solimangrovi]|uniref:nicotinate-nucleotide adenylyltransferase n=1 Tax=Robertkochia solimangrovi TaxID=2213046 RepID=UPI00117C2F00|nr:nicotinate-nucleotide adenylyltransferase [Robertkochia solimangrovi]TRZ40981.1 nicotinate-nucleotide adenylyltransferase [Robertkochia solimangrovi]